LPAGERYFFFAVFFLAVVFVPHFFPQAISVTSSLNKIRVIHLILFNLADRTRTMEHRKQHFLLPHQLSLDSAGNLIIYYRYYKIKSVPSLFYAA
jgi:hypothetical protein